MATSDKAKREANIARAAFRPAALSAVALVSAVNDLWVALGYPEEEKPVATAWAGSLERLHTWLTAHDAEIQRIRSKLFITPLHEDVRSAIENAARLKVGTPLEMARHFSLPLDVVFYVADGCPKINTMQRPWLRTHRSY